jgi:probable F420-dependent oxidoreductase
MRFAIPLPQFVADGEFDPDGFRGYVTRAEELGFESGWAQEQVLGTMPFLSPLEAMTFAAACTETLRLGCVVFVTPTHNPVHLAKNLATLDQMSRGRLEVGIGIGGGMRPLRPFGVSPERLVARFTEHLRLMKELWTEPSVTFKGDFWELEEAPMEPKPFQKPHPPVWFGASHPDALRRAARHGDGFFGAGSTTTAAFADQVPIVREALEQLGRDPAAFPIAKRVYVAVDDDVARAKARLADRLQQLYGAFLGSIDMTPVTVYGPPDVVAQGLQDVIDAGAELLLLNPMFDLAEQMERLAAEIIPQLR